MLIDGGERSEDDTVLSTIKKYEIDKIDVIVATHPQVDHISGLINVIS